MDEIKIDTKSMRKESQMPLGTWDKLPIEETERMPKVTFEINIPMDVTFQTDDPREFTGDNGAYYIFDVSTSDGDKIIMTSAWTLLKGLKVLSPLKDKKIRIVKRLEKGKQTFKVEAI